MKSKFLPLFIWPAKRREPFNVAVQTANGTFGRNAESDPILFKRKEETTQTFGRNAESDATYAHNFPTV